MVERTLLTVVNRISLLLNSVTPPTGYLGATLYWDDEKDGLDTDDKPVMFKFNVANT